MKALLNVLVLMVIALAAVAVQVVLYSCLLR